MQALSSFIMLIGRLCLSVVFLWSGFYKIFEFHSSIKELAHITGMTNDAATWVVIISLIVEIVFAILLVLGWLSRFAAGVLAVYTLAMIMLLNQFWHLDGVVRTIELMKFLKGLAIIGGLLFVLACGAGRCSCDASQNK